MPGDTRIDWKALLNTPVVQLPSPVPPLTLLSESPPQGDRGDEEAAKQQPVDAETRVALLVDWALANNAGQHYRSVHDLDRHYWGQCHSPFAGHRPPHSNYTMPEIRQAWEQIDILQRLGSD